MIRAKFEPRRPSCDDCSKIEAYRNAHSIFHSISRAPMHLCDACVKKRKPGWTRPLRFGSKHGPNGPKECTVNNEPVTNQEYDLAWHGIVLEKPLEPLRPKCTECDAEEHPHESQFYRLLGPDNQIHSTFCPACFACLARDLRGSKQAKTSPAETDPTPPALMPLTDQEVAHMMAPPPPPPAMPWPCGGFCDAATLKDLEERLECPDGLTVDESRRMHACVAHLNAKARFLMIM